MLYHNKQYPTSLEYTQHQTKGITMALSKAIKAKLDARKSEYEYNSETLNQKIAHATMTYHQGLPQLGSNTTTHAKLFLVFRDLLEMLEAVKNDYPKYEINQTYTRSKDGTWRVCLDKPESTQDRELEVIEADIKRDYKKSLTQIKEQVINEVIKEVEHEKALAEKEKQAMKAEKEHNDLRKALLEAA